jgi:hypothetical protein
VGGGGVTGVVTVIRFVKIVANGDVVSFFDGGEVVHSCRVFEVFASPITPNLYMFEVFEHPS